MVSKTVSTAYQDTEKDNPKFILSLPVGKCPRGFTETLRKHKQKFTSYFLIQAYSFPIIAKFTLIDFFRLFVPFSNTVGP